MREPNWRRGCGLVAALIALWIWLPPSAALAQIETGSITGLVTDQTGGALPGVSITVRNLATGQVRTVVTNELGRYLVTALQPSRYSVTAELTGFATTVRPEITVNVGSAADINIRMQVGAVQETVTVTGESPLVESTRTDLSSVITQQVLESLPSKNREYLDFTLLMPATVENVSQVQGTGAVIGGARSREGSLLVDGFYNLDEGFTMPKQRHSQDLVQEFQVVSFGGSAEHGRATGGVINVVTKSGGNQLHGSGYGFFRDTRLNSQDFGEKRRGAPKSEYDRQQGGATLGGPIKRDKSFFFGAFERVLEDWPYDNGIRPQDATAIGLPPEDVGTMPRFFRVSFAFGKWDHTVNNNHRLQTSYSYTRNIDHQVCCLQSLATRSRPYGLYPSDEVYLAKWTGLAADGRALHEVRAAYFPRRYGARGLTLGGPPLVPDGQLNTPVSGSEWGERHQMSLASPPTVTISSVASFGSVSLNNRIYTYPVQVIYTSSLFTQKHSVKFGADYLYAYYDYNQFSPYRGSYSFGSLANFLAGRYNQYQQSFGDTHNPRTHQYISGFIQDSWQVNNRLTMNYGLRYDLELNPEQEKSGIPFGNDYNNFGPRSALSYDLTGRGTTFVKLTTGVYYDKIWNNSTNNLYDLKDHQLRITAVWTPTDPGAPVYPQVFAQMPANIPRRVIDAIVMPDQGVDVPLNAQAVATIEHALTRNLAFSASAIYTRTWDKEFTWDTNLEWNGQRWVRPDANYRRITTLRYGGDAEYIGGIVEVDRRGARVGFNANLTVSRAYEDRGVNDQRSGGPDWGPMPDNPTVRGVLSGWYNINPYMQVSGAFRVRSGMAVDSTASGLDLNGDGNFGDRTPTLEPYAFRAPATNSVDVRFTWKVPFQNGRKLQLYIESFNLLNHENVRTVRSDYGPDPARPGPRWMEPSSFFPPREVQLGARFTF